jgi:hypothetical protein
VTTGGTRANRTYLVAKYIPDILRQEPRNIGILLYWDGEWSAQFDEDPENPAAASGAFLEWKGFWRDCLEKGVPPLRGGEYIAPDDGGFALALCQASRGNFALSPGLDIMYPAKVIDAKSAMRYLYNLIVA